MIPVRQNPEDTGRAVVIIDDERSYVELMAHLLEEHLDCAVHPFTRPQDALDHLRALSVGVIVTDYFMPQMDGIEFIRQASEVAPQAAFIMISGHNLEPFNEDLGRLKMLKMRLEKPFGWRPLAAAILRVWPGSDVPALR